MEEGSRREYFLKSLFLQSFTPNINPPSPSPPSVQRKSAIDLASAAISAGIFNDLGSGSNVDVCVITDQGAEMMRNLHMPNVRGQKEKNYKFRRGTTAWTKDTIKKLVTDETITPIPGDAMDIS